MPVNEYVLYQANLQWNNTKIEKQIHTSSVSVGKPQMMSVAMVMPGTLSTRSRATVRVNTIRVGKLVLICWSSY